MIEAGAKVRFIADHALKEDVYDFGFLPSPIATAGMVGTMREVYARTKHQASHKAFEGDHGFYVVDVKVGGKNYTTGPVHESQFEVVPKSRAKPSAST